MEMNWLMLYECCDSSQPVSTLERVPMLLDLATVNMYLELEVQIGA